MPPGGPLIKGHMFREVDGQIVDRYQFRYNPTTYKVTKGVKWTYSAGPGQYIPVASFDSFERETVVLSLLLDSVGVIGERVSDHFDRLEGRLQLFASPGPDFNIDQPQFVGPGRVRVVLGNRVYPCVMEKMETEYQMFDREFRPVRGTVNINMSVASEGIQADLARLNRLRARAGLSG